MSANLTPYNFTITDQSPLFQYFPFRDGAITNGWNVTYTTMLNPAMSFSSAQLGAEVRTLIGAGVSKSATFWSLCKVFQCQPSSHSTTFVGASARLDWEGTAIYLYGTGSQNGYTINLDGTQITQTPGDLSASELLFSQSGLNYGSHSLVLTVVQSEVTISNAIITVGLGEVGYVPVSTFNRISNHSPVLWSKIALSKLPRFLLQPRASCSPVNGSPSWPMAVALSSLELEPTSREVLYHFP